MQFLAGLLLQYLLNLLGVISFTASVQTLLCPVLAGQWDELALSSLICPSESPEGLLYSIPHHLKVCFLPFLYHSGLERRLLKKPLPSHSKRKLFLLIRDKTRGMTQPLTADSPLKKKFILHMGQLRSASAPVLIEAVSLTFSQAFLYLLDLNSWKLQV